MTSPLNITLGVALSAIMISGCASVPRATEGGQLKSFWGKISSRDYVRTRGVGAAPAKTQGLTARRGASRSAALVDARYNLLATIKGVRVSAGVTVAQLMERDSIVRELANDMVNGGDEILTEWTADDGCVSTLELKRSTVERLIQEKSAREKGLERRIAKDIEEIERLREQVRALGSARYNKDDMAELSYEISRLAHANQALEDVESGKFGSAADQLNLARTIDLLCNEPNGDPTGDCK